MPFILLLSSFLLTPLSAAASLVVETLPIDCGDSRRLGFRRLGLNWA